MAKADQNESKSVDPNITQVSKQVKTLLVRANRHDLLARYEVSALLKNVMADAKYGDNAITQMQSEVGLSKQSLYRIARIAQAWPESEFAELAKRPNVKGWPLTWSHFELLAMADVARRTDLVERALVESMTVAELAAAIRLAPQAQDTAGGASSEIPRPHIAAELGHWVHQLEQDATAWSDRLRGDVRIALQGLDEGGRENLKATVSRLKRMGMYFVGTADALDYALKAAPPAQGQQFVPAPQAGAAAGG